MTRHYCLKEGDQYIGTYTPETAPNEFLRDLMLAAGDDCATATDAEGCLVTACAAEDIDFSDNPELTPEMLARAVARRGLKPL
jgi:hypothetical protein